MATKHMNGDALAAVRERVERDLARDEIDLASADGRERTRAVIADAIDHYAADALNGDDGLLADAERDASCTTT